VGNGVEDRVSPAQLGQPFHVPQVSLVGVHRRFACQQVKRSELDVRDALDWPAISPIGVDEPVGVVGATMEALEQGFDGDARRACAFESAQRLAKPRAGGGADGGVLLAQQLLRLCRLWHQLAVEKQPIGLQPIEQADVRGGLSGPGEKLPLERVVFEEGPAGASKARAEPLVDDAETPARRILVETYDHDRPRAHVLLLADPRATPSCR
jgi:hypothetical protein